MHHRFDNHHLQPMEYGKHSMHKQMSSLKEQKLAR